MEKKYKSPSTGVDCTAAQYVTEIIMTRGKTLPQKFWNLPQHKKIFLRELYKVNAYIRIYGEDIIVNGVVDPKNKWIKTIFYKGWNDIFSVYTTNKIEEKPVETVDVNIKPAKQFGVKSKLQKLRDMDSE